MAGERRQDRPPAPRAIGGEQPFVEALAARYRGALTRFFERRAPQLKSDTEDLTQEVFLRLATRGAGEQIEHIDGYIFQTASSVLTDRARRNAVRAADRHVCYQEEPTPLRTFRRSASYWPGSKWRWSERARTTSRPGPRRFRASSF